MTRSNDETGTPPGTPRRRSHRGRRQRRARRESLSSASSSSENIVPRKTRKTKLSTKDILKLVKHVSKDSSKVSYNNFNNVVPEFDPSSRAQTIDCWIKKVNECAAIYDWDEKQTIHFSLQKLSGLAKRWFEALPTVVFSWEQWQMKLRKAFPCEDNYGRLLEEMLGRTSRLEESFKEYFYDKLGLLTRCGIEGRKAVDCIVYGINDKSVRNGAQILNCSEPEDLLKYLSSQQPRNLYTKVSRDRFQPRPNLFKETPDAAVTCYNCRQKGHPYFKCPRALVKCKKCNRIGHNNELCTLRPLAPKFNANLGDSAGEKRTMLIKNNNDSNTKYFKTIMINDKCLKAYIDFGSQCTLLRYSDAEQLKLEKKFDNVPLVRGFGQSTVTPIYKSNACIRIDEIEADVDILVVEDIHMLTSVIVGQNFTELPFITVLKNRHELIFYKSPNFDIQNEPKNNVHLYITKPTEVSTTSAISVHSDEPYTGDLYIDGYIVLIPGKEYRLLHGIYDIREGRGQVIIANFSPHKLTLKENTLIARAVPVNDPEIYKVNLINKDQVLQPLREEDIKTGSDLDKVQFNKLYSLLQQYRDCFATCLSELGRAKNVEMKIELTDRKPVVYRPYRLSHFEREQVRETINDLLQNDIIQESKSDYASPILMVKKKTGENRLCVDFRALNNKTLKERFPLPIIEDQISSLSGNRFFTTLDLASGYYQIPMSKDSCHLTGFVTSEGHFEFKRMPFGLTNAPATFQRVINRIFGNKRFNYVRAYLDDILIPSKNIEEMFDRLEEILILFRQNGLTLNLTKCSFFNTSVSYLGYEISSEGIKPGETKVLAVKKFPTPSNVHEIRQFLGLTGYFRKFIKGYGEIARPLTSLLRKDSSWHWSNTEKQAFELLRDSLVARPILSLYNPELETEVHTDASAMGIGGILMQWQSEVRVLKPVAYFSRQTTPEEKYFHSYELETLAVVCTLKKFRVYLLGTHFKVFTDCAALRTTLTKRDLIPRIARWWLQISEYSFEINYRPGVQMSHVDALSRNSRLCSDQDESAVVVYTIQKDNWLLSLQLADPEISKIFKILRPNNDPECRDVRQNYVIKDHTVYRKIDNKLCLVVPKSARWQICRANHDEIGHFGYTKTLSRIQTSYWFPKLRKFVKKYVDACLECAYHKDNASKQKTGYIHPIEKVPIPFHTIHIDHLGPFVKSRNGNTHILTVVDGFTKYVFIRAVRDLKTQSTVTVLQKIFFDFGVPARIVSDRGTSFTSAAFQSFCTSQGIKHVLNAVACPRANGQAERFNQTILNALAAQNSVDREDYWDRCLGKIQWGINNTINTTTQKTATEAMFGVKLRDALSNKLSNNNNNALSKIQDTREQIATNIQNNQNHQKIKHNKNRIPATLYKVDDLIKIARNNFDNNNKSTKLMSKFIGPYKITEVLGNDRYRITDIPGFNRKGKPYTTVIAADRIRPWVHIKTLELHESDKTSSDSDNSD